MPYLREIRRGLSNIGSFRQEQSAVPSAQSTPLLREFSRSAGAEATRSAFEGNRRQRTKYALANIGRDQRLANRDAAVSLPLTAAQTVVDYGTAKKEKQRIAEAEAQNKEVLDKLNAIGELYRTQPDRIYSILKRLNEPTPEEGGY